MVHPAGHHHVHLKRASPPGNHVHLKRVSPPARTKISVYNDLGSSSVRAKAKGKDEDKITDLYYKVQKKIAPHSNDLVINITYSSVTYTNKKGEQCQKDLSELTDKDPALAEAVQKLKSTAERVWGDKVRTPCDYESGRKGAHRGTQHQRAGDTVLKKLPQDAPKAVAVAAKTLTTDAEKTLLYKRMAAAEQLIASSQKKIKKRRRVLEDKQTANQKKLRSRKTNSAGRKQATEKLQKIQQELAYLQNIENKLDGVDYFALAMAFTIPEKALKSTEEAKQHAENVRKTIETQYTAAHEGICTGNERAYIPKKFSFLPDSVRFKEENPVSNAQNHALWVGGTVFAGMDTPLSRKAYGEYCQSHHIPLHDENLEDDIIRAVLSNSKKQTFTDLFHKKLEHAAKEGIKDAKDAMKKRVRNLSGTTPEAQYENVKRKLSK